MREERKFLELASKLGDEIRAKGFDRNRQIHRNEWPALWALLDEIVSFDWMTVNEEWTSPRTFDRSLDDEDDLDDLSTFLGQVVEEIVPRVTKMVMAEVERMFNPPFLLDTDDEGNVIGARQISEEEADDLRARQRGDLE